MADVTLPAPPVVIQCGRMDCWAASYESWNAANEAEFGVGGVGDATTLIRSLGTLSGHHDRSGGVTPHGMLLLGNLGVMRTRWLRGGQVAVGTLASSLAEGYVYCTYYTPRVSHAIVIYGVRGATVYAMNPWPRAGGFVQLPATFFADKVAVMLGTPLLVELARHLDGVAARLGAVSAAR